MHNCRFAIRILLTCSVALGCGCGGRVAIGELVTDGGAQQDGTSEAGFSDVEMVEDGAETDIGPDSPTDAALIDVDSAADAPLDAISENGDTDPPYGGCANGIRDGAESDVDCGGGFCEPCAVGGSCTVGADCVEGVCSSALCQPPSCDDQIQNGSETDVDCGGDCPSGCALCQHCAGHGDCAEGQCVGDECQLVLEGIGAGAMHACVIRSGRVWCWGHNWYGELGLGYESTQDVLEPTEIVAVGGDNLVVASKVFHTCTIKVDGSLWCWGINEYGQVKPNGDSWELLPIEVAGVSDAVELAPGRNHTCIRKGDGTVWCWGSNSWGNLGTGAPITVDNVPPQRVLLPDGIYTHVDSGSGHSCAVRDDGTLWCWGWNEHKQVDSSGTNRSLPVAVAGLPLAVADVSTGMEHTCALLVDGSLWCWGSSEFGQVGNGALANSVAVPVRVGGANSDFVSVAAADFHTCAVLSSGQVQCWGRNSEGEVGDGMSSEPRLKPVYSLLSLVPDEIVSGQMFTCARSGQTLWCWGEHPSRPLGLGVYCTEPLEVDFLPCQ